MRLDLRTDQGDDLVAQEGDGYVQSALSAAVEPDHQGILLPVALEGPGFIRRISKRHVP